MRISTKAARVTVFVLCPLEGAWLPLFWHAHFPAVTCCLVRTSSNCDRQSGGKRGQAEWCKQGQEEDARAGYLRVLKLGSNSDLALSMITHAMKLWSGCPLLGAVDKGGGPLTASCLLMSTRVGSLTAKEKQWILFITERKESLHHLVEQSIVLQATALRCNQFILRHVTCRASLGGVAEGQATSLFVPHSCPSSRAEMMFCLHQGRM